MSRQAECALMRKAASTGQGVGVTPIPCTSHPDTAAEGVAMMAVPEPSAATAKVRRMASKRLPAARVELAPAPGATGLSTRAPADAAPDWRDQVLANAGTTSPVFAERLMSELGNAAGADASGFQRSLEHGLAFIAGVQPENEVESALAAQMFAVHTATMELARRTGRADTIQQQEANGGLMVRMARTFTAQVEALAKLRTGGKQQVEVRYVYVDARGGQNIIGGELPGFGAAGATRGGGSGENDHQCLAPPVSVAGAQTEGGSPVWREDALGRALPVAGGPREEALPDARRPQPRRTSRRGERSVEGRRLQPGASGGTEGDAGAGAHGSDDFA